MRLPTTKWWFWLLVLVGVWFCGAILYGNVTDAKGK